MSFPASAKVPKEVTHRLTVVMTPADPTAATTYEAAPTEVGRRDAVVVAMGKGRFAFYAHLQPGSVRVEVGDTVKPGQVLGLLGTSGDSDAPHLHFHIMDGPRPLSSNGLPYRFSRFTSEGTLTNLAEIGVGQKAVISDTSKGSFENELPLDLQVVGFG